MALHESRKKRLLKLFRRAKRDDEPENHTTSEKPAGNGNGKQRKAPAMSSSRDRNIDEGILSKEDRFPGCIIANPSVSFFAISWDWISM